MTWARRTIGIATVALLSLLAAIAPIEPASADEPEPTPLTVTLTSLTPSYLPARGSIVLTGTVRNASEEPWTAINVHPFIGRTPITDREALDAASDTPETTEVGERMLEVGQFAAIGDLDPGASTRFTIQLKRRDLPISGDPGVYWIGVHALGQNTTGRDGIADGRARTFIPLQPAQARISAAVVVPIRARIRHSPDGRVTRVPTLMESVGGGRLARLAGLLDSAGSAPVTLLLDPAVLDAVSAVAAGNPIPLPAHVAIGTNARHDRAQVSRAAGNDATPDPDRPSKADQAVAARWVERIEHAAQTHTVLTLGYADPDTTALARTGSALLDRSFDMSTESLRARSITATAAVVPPSGWVDESVLDHIPDDAVIIASDKGAPRVRNLWRTTSGQSLVFANAGATAGGPLPEPRLSALAVRQRILAEAAVHDGEGPLTVSLPAQWDPGTSWMTADFFGGLQTPSLDLVPLRNSWAAPVFDAGLPYPNGQREGEIGRPNIAAAEHLVATATTFGSLLAEPGGITGSLTGIALTAVSNHGRQNQVAARANVLAVNGTSQRVLEQITLQGTDFVTLSGGTGTLTVTLTNQLDVPVVAGVRAVSDDPALRITAGDPQRLDAGQRAVIRLHASADGIGVYAVALTPVTTDGTAVGVPLEFSLRSSQVSRFIWGMMALGGSLLVVTIGLRIRRGLREDRWRGR